MIYCPIDEVPDGMHVAAPVRHPRREDVELLAAGVALDRRTARRLAQLGVANVWVDHEATADLDEIVDPAMGARRRAIARKIAQDFTDNARKTVTAGQITAYRQSVMELICELVSQRNLASLSEQMIGSGTDLFTHSSAVAYLALLVGLDLENYVVQSRTRLSVDKAKDMTGLGVGAMLHDIGKIGMDPQMRHMHSFRLLKGQAKAVMPKGLQTQEHLDEYLDHPMHGYAMLRDCRAPASATQVVLTHHHRWDGKGFPNLNNSDSERQRISGTGQAIHIFSRITAVANTLDGLLRADPQSPPVKALHHLRNERFQGWFDPVVRDAVIRKIPPFAIGSTVTLSDGRHAAIMAPNVDQPCRPLVRLLDASQRLGDGRYPNLDLAAHTDLTIVQAGTCDVADMVFDLAEPAAKPDMGQGRRDMQSRPASDAA